MTNNKQTSIDWFFDQLVLNRIIIINGTTYWDKVKTKYEILLQQAKEMYQDEIEAAIIKNCATEAVRSLLSEKFDKDVEKVIIERLKTRINEKHTNQDPKLV